MEEIDRIHKRQLARFPEYLKKTGQSNPGLETDIKRVFGYIFKDIDEIINGQDRENDNGHKKNI